VTSKRFARFVLGALLLVALSTRAPAQDPAVVNAKTIRVTLENERVRVLEAVLQPGDKEQLHSHPASVYYVVEGGKVRNHAADGTIMESELVAGQVVYRDPVTHWAENIGSTTLRIVLIELQDAP
jgi:quercetin dioxygenase-like cupin family protein